MTTKDLKKLEKVLWASADSLRANSDLSSNEYSVPVLGLIFLKFADNFYSKYEPEIMAEYNERKNSPRMQCEIHEIAIAKCGIYIPDFARYDYLLNLPGEDKIAEAIKNAMTAIEQYNTSLQGVLPKDEYTKLVRTDVDLPRQLLKNFSNIPKDASGDVLGQIYEYFLGNFALAEGQGGGEFFTPKSVVRLMVEIIEPHGGRVFDPACGSGGMFVQSARFIEEHHKGYKNGNDDIVVAGQEKTSATVNLAKMNLAVNNLRGEIKQANSYYDDPFDCYGRYDYVLANPPFNVDDVNLKKIEGDKRFNTYGIPRNKSKISKKDEGKETVPNGNYLWINLFATSLNEKGRAALVMANSASDARNSEAEIRKTLIENNLIYGMLSLPSNMFYTVTLPATLWFFDKAKTNDKVLFIDAKNIFTQIDRAHREFSDEQILNIALVSRLNRGCRDEFVKQIDGYFESAVCEIEPLKNCIKSNAASLEKFLGEFRNWYRDTDRDDEKKAKADEFRFEEKLHELAAGSISCELKSLDKIIKAYDEYRKELNLERPDFTNLKQRELAEIFNETAEAIAHLYRNFDRQMRSIETVYQFADKEIKEKNDKGWKEITNIKDLRNSLSELHDRISESYLRDSEYLEKSFFYFLKNVRWLQEKFPEAKYEDVTGLCKLASLEEIKEQDYSLNPGRYVGVVIEEDGMTEKEFIEELGIYYFQLKSLNQESFILQNTLEENINKILKES